MAITPRAVRCLWVRSPLDVVSLLHSLSFEAVSLCIHSLLMSSPFVLNPIRSGSKWINQFSFARGRVQAHQSHPRSLVELTAVPVAGATPRVDHSAWPASPALLQDVIDRVGFDIVEGDQECRGTGAETATGTGSGEGPDWYGADVAGWMAKYIPRSFSPYDSGDFTDTAAFVAILLMAAGACVALLLWLGKHLWDTTFSPR